MRQSIIRSFGTLRPRSSPRPVALKLQAADAVRFATVLKFRFPKSPGGGRSIWVLPDRLLLDHGSGLSDLRESC